ncbi:ASCH domain-containing protein [Occultella aeris]|uniref:ASCH domain protein n=1 Tax=Occultella aeris TaxID=2761496 RepID=A0A7M4DSJ3_9MICO|nr:ASCH domain-containing protein [Occultella aeris]VZO40437.1 ASCH domain protein [Occultella aeris]
MQTIGFHPDYLEPVRAGTKVTTVRYREDMVVGPAELVFDTQPTIALTGEVTGVRRTRLDELTDADARADGFADRDALIERLRTVHYPDLPDDADVTVVYFRADGPA